MNSLTEDSYFARLCYMAQLGFDVVPVLMPHPQHGMCEVKMNGEGILVENLARNWKEYRTWEGLKI